MSEFQDQQQAGAQSAAAVVGGTGASAAGLGTSVLEGNHGSIPPPLGSGGGSVQSMVQLFSHLADTELGAGPPQANPTASAALHKMAGAGGGGGVPQIPLVQRLERELGTSFSDVRIHTDGEAAKITDSVQAGAVNYGKNIFFAPGRFDVSSAQGQRLLAEELTHFAQHGGGSHAGKPRLGATTCSAESEAQAVADAAVTGAPLPTITRGQAANVARRGEAPVHQGIIMEAGDVGEGPQLAHDIKKPAPRTGTRNAGLLEVYSGNFMRDYSQLNVPLIANLLSKTPKSGKMLKNIKNGSGLKYEAVGAAGGESIALGLIRALAIIELGKPITDANVTKQNIGSYRPQEHIDNPMGTRAAELLVRDHRTHQNRAAVPVTKGADLDRDGELAGAAVPGMQVDNPQLYNASPRGLSNHIYNSVEYAKSEWLKAAQAGPTSTGRMHLGAGLHVVEDYFSHSNFIEVALNRYIDRLIKRSNSSQGIQNPALRSFVRDVKGISTVQGPGRYVDTLFDAKVPAPGGRGQARQVVTTGSFGGTDTKVSIAHMLLPKLPKLQDALMRGIDRLVGLPVEKMTSEGMMGLLKQDRSVQALYELGSGLSQAGVTVPVPKDWHLTIDSPYLTIDTEETDILSAIPKTGAFIKHLKEEITSNPLFQVISVFYDLSKLIDAKILEIRERIRSAAKEVVAQLMVQLIGQLIGMDPEKLAKMQLGDMLALADHEVSHLEAESSIASRLHAGGDLSQLPREEVEKTVGPVKGHPGHYEANNPLPPSHSEISKDHAPHKERLLKSESVHPGEPEHADGSLFYGLHRVLAVEADRHVFTQMQAVCSAAQGGQTDRSLFGDGVLYGTTTRVQHGQVLAAGSERADEEQQRAKADGFAHGPKGAHDREYLAKHPEAQALLNLADLFISHPDDSSWWHPLLDDYVSRHEAEVVAHIQARNRVRGDRK